MRLIGRKPSPLASTEDLHGRLWHNSTPEWQAA
jgi:hypothetical protein